MFVPSSCDIQADYSVRHYPSFNCYETTKLGFDKSYKERLRDAISTGVGNVEFT